MNHFDNDFAVAIFILSFPSFILNLCGIVANYLFIKDVNDHRNYKDFDDLFEEDYEDYEYDE